MGLIISDRELSQLCRSAGVPMSWHYVAGSAKQKPYVLLEWNRGADHIHLELGRFASNNQYKRIVSGATVSSSFDEFVVEGFHIKSERSFSRDEEVHDYIGFDYMGGNVWDASWGKKQTKDRAEDRFYSDSLSDEAEGDLMRYGRQFLADLGDVIKLKQTIGNGLKRG